MPKIVDHQARRVRIAEAALDQIGRHGLDRVRLADIARAVDATTGTVTHYFDGKDALLGAALDRLATRLYDEIERTDGKDFFGDLARALPVDAQGRRDWRVWLCYWGRAISDAELASRHNTHYARIQAAVAESLAEAQRAGDVNPDVPAEDLADAIIAAVDGIGTRAALAPRAWPAARQQALLETMLRPLLDPPPAD
ncbi:MAG: TetR/AcrR family transcriptional regulator [Myxococcota bacterium]